jgi:hypothetical protein
VVKDWFADCKNLKEAQVEYRRLCFEHHPDHGGDTAVMQAINVAYQEFKREQSALRSALTKARARWKRPQRQRPADVPPTTPHAEARPVHSRDYFKSIWRREPWQPLPNGALSRTIWDHTILLFQHPSPRYQGAWFVLLDDVFSPFMYDSRDEAEQSAFELVYDKVKHRDL